MLNFLIGGMSSIKNERCEAVFSINFSPFHATSSTWGLFPWPRHFFILISIVVQRGLHSVPVNLCLV